MKRKTRQDYLNELKAQKAALAQSRGVKYVRESTAKKDPEYKKITKRLKDFEARQRRAEVREKSQPVIDLSKQAKTARGAQRAVKKALPDSVVQTIAFKEVYHLVLSYGGKVERAIEDAIAEGERMGFKVKIRINHRPYGRSRVYQSRLAATMAFQRLYMDLVARQGASGGSGENQLISAFTQDKGGERIITIQTSLT